MRQMIPRPISTGWMVAFNKMKTRAEQAESRCAALAKALRNILEMEGEAEMTDYEFAEKTCQIARAALAASDAEGEPT